MKSNLLIPMIIGAATTAALTYIFATESGADMREKLAGAIKERLPDAGEKLSGLLSKVKNVKEGL